MEMPEFYVDDGESLPAPTGGFEPALLPVVLRVPKVYPSITFAERDLVVG